MRQTVTLAYIMDYPPEKQVLAMIQVGGFDYSLRHARLNGKFVRCHYQLKGYNHAKRH